MKILPWSALAMCIDCEGTISISKHNKTEEGKPISLALDITAVNTDERLMKWLVSNFGGRYYARVRYSTKWKTSFAWRVTGRKNKEKILLGILPHLIMKREQALLGLEYIRMGVHERNPEKRRMLGEACQKLNAKGPMTPETNTQEFPEVGNKIESVLTGDSKSELPVTEVLSKSVKACLIAE